MIDLNLIIDEVMQKNKEVSLTEANKETYQKLSFLLNILKNRINNPIAQLTTDSTLSNLQNCLTNIKSYVDTDIQNVNNGYYIHVKSQIDSVITYLNQIPCDNSTATKQNLTALINSYKQQSEKMISAMSKQLDVLTQEKNSLDSQLLQVKNQLTQKETEVTTLTTNFQQLFSTAQEKRISDFTTLLDELKDDFETKEGERQDSFTKNEKSRDSKITEKEIKMDSALKTFQQNSISILNAMKDTKKETEEIYNLVGKTVLVGDKKVYADGAKGRADNLFYASIAIMIITALIVVWPLLCKFASLLPYMDGTSQDIAKFDWWLLVPRLFITPILLLPAFYLANESKKQRDQEHKFRDLEVKINAIDPYLLKISSKDSTTIPLKDKIKLDLAKELLGKDVVSPNDENIIIPKDVLTLIDKVSVLIAKIKKD